MNQALNKVLCNWILSKSRYLTAGNVKVIYLWKSKVCIYILSFIYVKSGAACLIKL